LKTSIHPRVDDDPEEYIQRIDDKRRRGAIRAEDEAIVRAGIEWAKAELAKRELKQAEKGSE
jgi:hypothetical protein